MTDREFTTRKCRSPPIVVCHGNYPWLFLGFGVVEVWA